MNTRIRNAIITGLIAGSCVSYLLLNPEPEFASSPYHNQSTYKLWNYQNSEYEYPECSTDMECAEKYGEDEWEVTIEGSRKF